MKISIKSSQLETKNKNKKILASKKRKVAWDSAGSSKTVTKSQNKGRSEPKIRKLDNQMKIVHSAKNKNQADVQEPDSVNKKPKLTCLEI